MYNRFLIPVQIRIYYTWILFIADINSVPTSFKQVMITKTPFSRPACGFYQIMRFFFPFSPKSAYSLEGRCEAESRDDRAVAGSRISVTLTVAGLRNMFIEEPHIESTF